MLQMAAFSGVAIALHNFPEGFLGFRAKGLYGSLDLGFRV